MGLVVLKRCRREGNSLWWFRRTQPVEHRQSPFDLDAGNRIDFVRCLGSNDVRQFKAFVLWQIPTSLSHDIGRLFLFVDFATISDGR